MISLRIFPSPIPGGFKPGRHSELFRRIYEAASEKPPRIEPGDVPHELADYVRLLHGERPQISPPPSIKQIDPRTLVAFSGGKDSAATALRLIRRGFKPIPVFVEGINRAYPHELAAASQVARALGLVPPLIISVAQSGYSPFIENPAKNQLLAAMLADAAEQRWIGGIALGTMAQDSIAKTNPDAGLSDAAEMNDAAAAYFAAEIPSLAVHSRVIENDTDAWLELADSAAFEAALEEIRSCMMPARYAPQHRRNVREKLGLPLREGRCGTCYKCASEALHLHLMNFEPLEKPAIAHYLAVLRRSFPTVTGREAASEREAAELFIDARRLPLDTLCA